MQTGNKQDGQTSGVSAAEHRDLESKGLSVALKVLGLFCCPDKKPPLQQLITPGGTGTTYRQRHPHPSVTKQAPLPWEPALCAVTLPNRNEARTGGLVHSVSSFMGEVQSAGASSTSTKATESTGTCGSHCCPALGQRAAEARGALGRRECRPESTLEISFDLQENASAKSPR